jgi:hypothetical protein
MTLFYFTKRSLEGIKYYTRFVPRGFVTGEEIAYAAMDSQAAGRKTPERVENFFSICGRK